MTPFEVPLNPIAQKLSIVLANVTYNLTVKWNSKSECWVVDLADANDVPIVSGIPLVTGADLFEQYGYLALGGGLIVQTDHDQDLVPAYAALGSSGHVYFIIAS